MNADKLAGVVKPPATTPVRNGSGGRYAHEPRCLVCLRYGGVPRLLSSAERPLARPRKKHNERRGEQIWQFCTARRGNEKRSRAIVGKVESVSEYSSSCADMRARTTRSFRHVRRTDALRGLGSAWFLERTGAQEGRICVSGSLMFIKPGFVGLRFGSWSRLVRWIACWWSCRTAGRQAWRDRRAGGLGQ